MLATTLTLSLLAVLWMVPPSAADRVLALKESEWAGDAEEAPHPEPGTLWFASRCNSGGGTYLARQDNGEIVIESTHAWRPCSREQDAGEADLLATLDAARRFEATRSELRVLDGGGRVLLVLRRAG